MNIYRDVAEMIFTEYNDLASEYQLAPFENIEEVEQSLVENITEDDAARLEDDEMARMALGGFLAGLMMQATIFMEGADEGETTH